MKNNKKPYSDTGTILDEMYRFQNKLGYLSERKNGEPLKPILLTGKIRQALGRLKYLEKRWKEITGSEYTTRL